MTRIFADACAVVSKARTAPLYLSNCELREKAGRKNGGREADFGKFFGMFDFANPRLRRDKSKWSILPLKMVVGDVISSRRRQTDRF